MPNPAYVSGTYFERRALEDLRHNGYICWRTPGSKSVVDIIALKPGQVLLIQAKAGLTAPTGTEWNALFTLANMVGATPLIADRAGRGRIRYRRITHPHSPHKHDWPAMIWTPDDAELAAAINRHPAGKQRS
jgi:Holliday junction resolvase